MTKNIAIEKKHSGKTSHKKSSAYTTHPNGAFPRNSTTTGRFLKKKILDNGNRIALGIIAMGLASAATFLVLNKQNKNRNFNRKLYNAYNDMRDDAKEFAHNAYTKGKRAYDTVSDYAENIKDTAYDVIEQPYSVPLLLAGAAGGTILGASLIYLLNKNKKTERGFLNKAIDAIDSLKNAATAAKENVKSTNWGTFATELVEAISESLREDREDEESVSRSKGRGMNHLQSAIDMGINGFRLWQKLKNKR